MIRLFSLACLALCACTALVCADAPGESPQLPLTIAADLTQVVTSANGAYLLVNVSLENRSRQPLNLLTTSVKLRIGGAVAPHEVPDEDIAVLVESDESSTRRTVELPWFEEDVVPAGEKLVRWCCFNLGEAGFLADDPTLFQVPQWSVVVEAPGGTSSFNLKRRETEALGVRCRPSKLAAAVTVVEIGERVNSLNVALLAKLLDDVLSREPGAVVDFTHGKCLIEEHAARRFDRFQLLPRSAPHDQRLVVIEDGLGRGRAHALGLYSSGPSEDVATVMVLGHRFDVARELIGLLSHDSPDVRIAATTALGHHVASAEVREALARLARQSEPRVMRQIQPPIFFLAQARPGRARPQLPRTESTPESNLRMTAILALGSRTVTAAQGRTPQSNDTLAILAALDDTDPVIRSSAISVAERFAFPQVIDKLMRLLDDPAVQRTVCQKLADLKHVAARDKIDRLRSIATDPWVQFAAIQALERLGVMSHREAFLARLDAGELSDDDCSEIIRIKDPRSISKLMEVIKNDGDGRRAQSVIEALVALRIPETVEPLIELLKLVAQDPPGAAPRVARRGGPSLRFGRDGEQTIVSALAALGDPKAIEPIRSALAGRRQFPLSHQLVHFDALLTLKAPDALPAGEQLVVPNDVVQATELLTMLARHNDEQVLPSFTEFLKNGSFAAMAAEKLSYLSFEGAERLLSERLRQTGHPMHSRWVEGVRRNPLWLAKPEHKALVSGAAATPVPYRNPTYRNAPHYEAAERRQVSREPWPRREMLGDATALKAWFSTAALHPAGAIECRVDLTQDLAGLFLRIKLVNRTDAELQVRASDFALQVGEGWSAAVRILPDAPEETVLNEGAPRVLRASRLPYWSEALLAPGKAAEGWLAFELPRAKRKLRGDAAASPGWTLWFRAGEKATAFNLFANEADAFRIVERRSALDQHLPVIEVQGRINCINASLFVERLQAATANRQDYIVDVQDCIVGSGAVERWKTWLKKHCKPDESPQVAVGKLSEVHNWAKAPDPMRRHWTEAQATIAHLERRPGGGTALVKRLAHKRPEIRAAAAAALAVHLDEDGVAEALAAAFGDTHPEVRGAAVQAIAYAKKSPPYDAVKDGSAVEVAVLRAIDSPDDSVRHAALQATRWLPGKRVEQALRDLADASPVESLASDLLAKRTSKVAGEEATGAGSPSSIDDVLAKLDAIRISRETFQEAGKLHDPRIIAKLISLALLTDVGMLWHQVDQGAVLDALVTLRAMEAVEPLAALLRQPARHRNEHAILNALVLLGDRRAIESIKQAISNTEPEWRFRLDYYVALAQLGDRDALDTLANLLKEPLPQIETRQLLWSLVRSGCNELVALVEPLLDDEDFCSETADCLARNGGSQGLEMLKRQLTKEDDPLVAALFQGLQRDPEWHASPTGQGLLGDVARNGSAEAKRFAEDLLSEE